MAEQFYTILTAIGKAKIANAAALGEKVELIELALGDGGGSYYNPTEDQTELQNEVWRGSINAVEVDTENPNWITIQTVVPSQHGGFMIREAGVFDNEGDLIAVGKYPQTYKPRLEEGSAKDLYIRMILEVSNTASVVLEVDPTVILATQQQVIEAETRAKDYTDLEVGKIDQKVDAHLADYAQHSVTMGHENDLYVAKISSLLEFTSLAEDYGGDIYAIATDDEFVYISGATQTVIKLEKNNLLQIAESADYGSIIYTIAVDDEFIYVGGWDNETVRIIENRDLIKIVRRYQ